jgi:hypothetical protein
MKRLLVAVLLALAAAPAALASGPMPYAMQNGPGVLSPGGLLRYVVVAGDRNSTTVEAVATRGGTVHGFAQLLGPYGIPYTTTPDFGEGLSADGGTLVLGDASTDFPRTHSAFAILDAPRLRIRDVFSLKGDFAYDALSPDGSRLYLIQHVSRQDLNRYVVRAYDVNAERLLPGRVADRTQKGWVMEGYPIARVVSRDGRWDYTLYSNPRNVPFVHALDTVRGVAHCVGLPSRGDAAGWKLRLQGGSLAVGPWRIDTGTWRVSPSRGGGIAWWLWALVGLVLAAATIVAAHVRRTRALAAGAAGRDRSPARLGSWLPLTPTRFRPVRTSSSRSSRSRTSGTTSSARRSSPPSTSAPSGSSSATTRS